MYTITEFLIGGIVTLIVIAVLAIILSKCFPLYPIGEDDE